MTKKGKWVKNPGVDFTTPPVFERDEPGENSESQEPDSRFQAPNPKSGEKYILIWHSLIELDQIYFPGDKIGENVYQQMPNSLKPHWWEIGRELPPHIYNKLAANLQKYFKVKTP